MAYLSTLSTELRILIIEHLNRTRDAVSHDSKGSDLGRDVRKLPKVNADILHLSCVNRSFRSLVAPYLFRTLVLRNNVRSGKSVNFVANSKYAKFVEKLDFVGISTFTYNDAPGPASRDAELIDTALPSNVEHILSNLDMFPSLEKVSVRFGIKKETKFGVRDYVWNYLEVCATHAPWPTFMDTVYESIARTSHDRIKSLTLRDLVAYPCPSWQSTAWHTLLNGLTSIHLTLNGEQGCWDIAHEPYNTFIPLLKTHFWDHLPNVTHLSFSASPNGFLGVDFAYIEPVPLSFGASNLPNLEVLSLDHVFMGTAVVDMMRQHATTLRSVTMQHVFVARSNSEDHTYGLNDEPQTTWAGIFNTLSATNMKFLNLVRFEGLCTGDESNPELRYALVDYESGEIIVDGFDVEEQRRAIYSNYGGRKRLVREAEEGVQADLDQFAYEGFMQIVRGNQERSDVV